MSNITITLSKLLLIPTLMFGISCSSNEEVVTKGSKPILVHEKKTKEIKNSV